MNFNSLIPKNYVQREIELKIINFLEDREIIVIRGPRQCGKSTLLKKIGLILEEKYSLNRVFLIDLEDEIEKMKFEKNPKEYLDFYLQKKEKVFLLLDEIQYVKKGGKILKMLFDIYPNIKFIVSGSSSLDIGKLGEYLVGRAVFFELYPFSFAEFLKAKNDQLYLEHKKRRFNIEKPKKTDSLFINKLNIFLKEYLTYGGYPRIVLENEREKKIILLKNLFSTYVEKDIIKLYGIKYKEKVITILKYLSVTIGNLLNYHDICQTANCHFQELKDFINIFEETYILKKIFPYHKNLVSELKKNPKIYFFDLGLRNTLLERFEFTEEEWGRMLENFGFLVYKNYSLSFWRTTAKAEVDFILRDKIIPIEVKATPKVTRSLLSFIESYQPKIAVIANLNESSLKKRNRTNIFLVPLSLI